MKHIENCMCDECITRRAINLLSKRATDQLANSYIERRGGEIGSISVSKALKERK